MAEFNNKRNFKKLCVTYRDGKDYYPPSIPRERGNLSTVISLLLITFSIICDIITNADFKLETVLIHYVFGYLSCILLHVLYRLILLCEEYQHFTSRYKSSHWTILKNSLNFTSTIWFTIAGSLIISTYFLSTNGPLKTPSTLNFHTASLIVVVFLLSKILKLDSCTLMDSLKLSDIHGMDYGSGMAYSFMYGYLKLVLPKTGNESKHLRELMEDYEAQNKVKFSMYKLFILIPTSLQCFVSLADNSESVEESQNLPEKIITVAGVRNRSYKNAVYKITCDKKKVYVCAEYATPLKTYSDVFRNTHANSAYFEEHKDDITLHFYLTLRELLKSERLEEFCELVFFTDSYKDETGKTRYYDVGKILLSRLHEIKKYHCKDE